MSAFDFDVVVVGLGPTETAAAFPPRRIPRRGLRGVEGTRPGGRMSATTTAAIGAWTRH
jgi:alkyl hydroperoxide reductase subunit AhpF